METQITYNNNGDNDNGHGEEWGKNISIYKKKYWDRVRFRR